MFKGKAGLPLHINLNLDNATESAYSEIKIHAEHSSYEDFSQRLPSVGRWSCNPSPAKGAGVGNYSFHSLKDMRGAALTAASGEDVVKDLALFENETTGPILLDHATSGTGVLLVAPAAK